MGTGEMPADEGTGQGVARAAPHLHPPKHARKQGQVQAFRIGRARKHKVCGISHGKGFPSLAGHRFGREFFMAEPPFLY